MTTQRYPGLSAGVVVHTPDGIRSIESLVAGDTVLTLGTEGHVIEKRVTAVSGPVMRPAVRVFCYGLGEDEEVSQRLIVAGDQLFHVVGAVDADPDFPPPQGWIQAGQMFRSQVVQQSAAPGAQVASVDPVWRTRSEGIGWIDLDRDSDAGSTIDMRAASPVEARPVPGATGDFPDQSRYVDRYSDEASAEACAYRCPMHGITLEDGAPLLVGERGFVVASL